MKADIDDYKKEICIMIDKINKLSCIIRIYSFVRRIFSIEMEVKKED